MTSSGLGSLLVGAGAGLALAASPAQPHPVSGRPAAIEAAVVLKGKICRTRTGASFSFGADGRYAYDGLWQSSGRYEVGDRSVIVTFDSGLRRAFALSSRGGVLYLDETAVFCSAG